MSHDGGKWVLWWVFAILFCYLVLGFGIAVAVNF